MNANVFFSKSFPAIIFILVIGALIYSNSFGVPFVFDDQESIVSNPVIRNLENFYANYSGYEEHPHRFIGDLTFALNYRFGGLQVFGYHLFNLVIHLGNGLLLYALVRLIFRSPYLRASRLAPRAGEAALIASLLFVVHPVQTQAVTYIVQRLASLTTFFYLLALLLYAQARLLTTPGAHAIGQPQPAEASWWKPALLLAGSFVSAVLAMKTKEIAFTLPFAAMLLEASFFRGPWPKRLSYLLPLLLTALIVPLSVVSAGGSAGDLLSDVGGQLRANNEMPRMHYLFSQFRVIVTYLRLLVLPVNQNLDYDYPVYSTFFTPPIFLSFLLLVSLLGLAVYLYFTSRPKPHALGPASDPAMRLIGFGIIWFFLTLSVESSLIPIEDIIFEHRLYLPAIGAFIAAAAALLLAAEIRFQKAVWLAVALIILCFGVGTYRRNGVWQSSVSLWRDVVQKSPGKVRPYNNLGAALNDAGQPQEAIPVLTQAVRVKPDHADAWYNLGRSYLFTNQSGEAVKSLQEAIRLNPDYDDAFVNLAAALNRERRFADAAQILEGKLGRLGGRAEARFNLGVAYFFLGKREGARRELQAVVLLDPRIAAPLADLLRAAGK
jgi:cytochrome c-type biogenesis protein CcmH/NrfG